MNRDLPKQRDYAIGLVLYHPEESLLRRVDMMVALGFRVYVFDNSAFDDQCSRVVQDNPNVNYLTAGKNVGIGYSLSTLCATAYANGYPRLLFLDQDTGISRQTLEFIESFSQSLSLDTQQQYFAVVFKSSPAANKSIQEVRLAISSGSLFNLAALKHIGWHNENYFVDCVDYEVCLRAKRHGYKVGIVCNTPDFDHVSEQPDRSIFVMGRQVLVRRYSSKRIVDALGAYAKLIISSLINNNLKDAFLVIKSAGIYFSNQLIARAMKDKE